CRARRLARRPASPWRAGQRCSLSCMILFSSSLGSSSASNWPSPVILHSAPDLSAVAPLVLLARPAPARIVAADLTGRARGYGCRLAQRRRLELLRPGLAADSVRPVQLARAALRDLPHKRGWRRRGRIPLDLDPVDGRHDVGLDPLAELGEHLERLVLVLDQGIALAVSPE